MILIDDGNTELGRVLLETRPEYCEVMNDPGEFAISAYPTVVVRVPAYAEDRPLFGTEGEFLGMARDIVPAHQELLRMPASWAAVDAYVEFVAARAAANPPE